MNTINVLVTLVAPILVTVYLISFMKWLWRQHRRLGAAGVMLLLIVSCGGTLTYFTYKMMS